MDAYDLLVIGGGAAGMAGALGAKAAGAGRVLLAERLRTLGGVLPQCLHSGFGLGYFAENLTGPAYADRFIRQMPSSGVEVRCGTTVTDLFPNRTARLSGQGRIYEVSFQAALLATGCRETPLGALPVYGQRLSGVFTAGAAQRLVNLHGYDIGDNVLILGSGDIGLIMARQLTLLHKRVIAIVEQRDALGGMARNRRDCVEALHIPVLLRATVEAVYGRGRIHAASVLHLDTGRLETIPCDTLITAVGLVPERELAAPLLDHGVAPPWLTFCGNCSTIHDIVDSVTVESARLGKAIGAEIGSAV